ncbi:hypothetical protein CCR97_04120 [Rhodoplanes elegans]|uniref:Uncharacterized protein n=1 Tax=Rhodoplanes elegans TaxID=29408 RepID=A0A327KL18_9BRAD|nr:hypothetical protein [Rhodoplanes elegans]MBK5957395.1 hypothetical protein [Rhodoplanes elegans]RAI38165.1 hypothetical protein CH338_13685 [Rhodoplanes elegans]
MTDGTPGDTPLAEEPIGIPGELHRVAQGIIAARDARIAVLEAEVAGLKVRLAEAQASLYFMADPRPCMTGEKLAEAQAALRGAEDGRS